MTRPPGYGIIYNWDGSPYGYSEVPQTIDQLLEKVYAPLRDTQVGALFWCTGTHAATWRSDVLELVGDFTGRRYRTAGEYVAAENLRSMLERGEDPIQAIVERGHELGLHVYASVRMNDNHFDGMRPDEMASSDHGELTRLRVEHPEWLLGEQTSEWFALSWNFAVPEVREHRLAHIEELCGRYDWDGVELDWQRHAFHLPRDEAYRLRYVLTDVQRAVSEMARRIGRERGRPFYVAARVAPTLEVSRGIGYDVPAWVDEGLVDLLVPSGGYGMDPSIDAAAYQALCDGKDTALYPGLDVGIDVFSSGEHGRETFVGPEDRKTKDDGRIRAAAARYHQTGADGVYVFNWHADGDSRRDLLTRIGSAETLRGSDKVYAATHRYLRDEGPWRGALRNDRVWGEVPVPLKATLTAEGPTVAMEVADDFARDEPARIELRVRLSGWIKGDVVRLLWDGTRLDDAEVAYQADLDDGSASNPFGADLYDVSSDVWLSCSLDPVEVPRGRHEVKVVLEERNPRMASDLMLTDVELAVTYGGGS